MDDHDPAAALLDDLAGRIYSPPFFAVRERLLEFPIVLSTVVLVIDFDTELSMQGILGFLENSTGRFVPETIAAFERIGASRTARTLASIHDILLEAGASPEALRRDNQALELYQVTTFKQSHPTVEERTIRKIEKRARELYLNDTKAEPVLELLQRYVSVHLDELRAAVSTWAPPDGGT